MKHISLIQSFYPSFSKQEKKIAQFVIEQSNLVSYMSLQEITKKIKVSEATIVRFVKKLGYKGFIEFKLEVAKENMVENPENSDDFIEVIHNNINKTINSTKELINKEDINKAIKLIETSNKVYIYGLGASGVAAIEMQNRFLRYGKFSTAITDSHFQIMYSSTTTSNDLIIVISLSGETIDLIYPLNVAKNNNCKIIAITNYIMSPIAKMADICLLTAGKETPLNGGSLIAKISQLYLIDIIATAYAIKNMKNATNAKEKIAIAVANKNKE
ncbi:MurR/RpiR family transcriptional regulator [Caviibacter abscessus]|uniref:MurR/RpiR family transcriptional regulator n=1 Tax=Caviibacter abscessus TaxID=1766719 RepID=UPI000834B387|nr:MurR/RpiR family transcriptional regulator [Caviibacter abscessus]